MTEVCMSVVLMLVALFSPFVFPVAFLFLAYAWYRMRRNSTQTFRMYYREGKRPALESVPFPFPK